MQNAAASGDAALGSVLGALVGDATGAVLEFVRDVIEPDDVAHAMTMPGGGIWKVAPGQITDDGELTMSLLRGLIDAGAADRPRPFVAKRYAAWVASSPFDIGATTARSLGWAARRPEVPAEIAMSEAAQEACMGSKANGSLMRATPLAVWGARRSDAELIAVARDDATLSHPNPACVDACVAYVLAIASLIREPGDAALAVTKARDYLALATSDPEVRGWLVEAEAGVKTPYSPLDGFVRIAFTHAFRHLVLGTSYEDALRETLLGGGDTDTNACIVGGLLGARWGVEAIPEALRGAVLGCDTARGKNARPAALHPRDVPSLVASVLLL